MNGGILLDTCTLLWLAADQSKLSPDARQTIADHADSLYISGISAFEIGAKHAKGALKLPMEPWLWFRRAAELHGIRVIPVTARIAIDATQLPPLHRDPCDRMIIATARRRRMTILTPDEHISAYPHTAVRW